MRLSDLTAKLKNIHSSVKSYELDLSLGLLAAAITIFVFWLYFCPKFKPEYQAEFIGLIFDIIFILGFLKIFEGQRRRESQIERQREIIDDYKRWDSEESRFRIAGAIRRLNKLGIQKLDLKGISLSDFKFAENEISSIEGTTFYEGTWGEPLGAYKVNLNRVEFDHVCCKDVQFSPYHPFGGIFHSLTHLEQYSYATFSDCSFTNSDLSGAKFDGALLIWTEPFPNSHYEYTDEENGEHHREQVSYGPFDEADLSKTSFNGAHFKNADFRGAENIALASFKNSTGLETCVFDSEAEENVDLKLSRAKFL